MSTQRSTAREVVGTPLAAGNLLGDFLRAHRARLTPEEAGVTSYGARRVPGLRREELARLAGVSANYYTRLEQGEAMHPSASVIAALARALRLDEDATTYLHNIAGTAATAVQGATGDPADPDGAMAFTFERIVHHMPDTAALTLSQTNDVLSCNPLARKLFFGHLAPLTAGSGPWNTHRLLFTDPRTRELYRDWREEASLAVASLRFHAASHPTDPAVRDLVGELSVASDEFARLWAAHPVRRCTRGTKHLVHPELGDLDLEYQMLHAPDGDGRRVLVHAAAPGGAAEKALRALSGVERPARPV